MSDKPISVGDLVMVVRGCTHCGAADSVGHVFIAQWIGMCDGATGCCRNYNLSLCADDTPDGNGAWEASRLKRIDPGILSEDVPTDERVVA